MQKGITLVETLTVMAIVAVLAGMAYSLSGPARESARRTTCASNLKQLYSAMQLYAADQGSDGEMLQMPNVPLMTLKRPALLEPYLGSKDVFYCPNFPAHGRSKMMSSYQISPLGLHLYPEAKGQWKLALQDTDSAARKKGDRTPLIICFIHDETYERPQEANLDPLVTEPFVVELLANGSVASGRRPYLRPNLLQDIQ